MLLALVAIVIQYLTTMMIPAVVLAIPIVIKPHPVISVCVLLRQLGHAAAVPAAPANLMVGFVPLPQTVVLGSFATAGFVVVVEPIPVCSMGLAGPPLLVVL